jgi:glycerophosphoryl diester phosphodiesterase
MGAPGWLTARPIAHRGYHDSKRIENTLPAAEAAIAHNFAIECDLQLTADGAVVVFHDDTLDRLTRASGPVASKALAEIRAVRFRDGDATIPTLEELLDLVDGRVPLVIEMKSAFAGDRRLEAAASSILLGYAGPAAVMSSDPASMIAMRRHAPSLSRGMIAGAFRREDWPALSLAARLAYRSMAAAALVLPAFVAYDVKALPASSPLALRHFFHLPLLTWTVRSEADRATAKAWADQIIFEGFDPDTP